MIEIIGELENHKAMDVIPKDVLLALNVINNIVNLTRKL